MSATQAHLHPSLLRSARHDPLASAARVLVGGVAGLSTGVEETPSSASCVVIFSRGVDRADDALAALATL